MSDKAIKGLEPKLVWEHFYGISQVPRPSKKEEKVRAWVRNWATEHNFKFKEDKVGNIVISVPASKGKEKSPTIVLQGHIDMVCEKNKGTVHDFENDPIKLVREGGWITADGTTLGADNGIGVAAGMAVALDKKAVHGPLELLLTIDEETGMTGVNALKKDFITGKTLLNMDSEEDGAFYVGCSGGQDTVGTFNIDWVNAKRGTKPFEVQITGLKGGHSGLDIHIGRANAIKLLGQFLNQVNVQFQIAEVSGGSLRNAIPREAEVVVMLNPKDLNKFKSASKKFVANALLEYKTNDPGLVIKIKKLDNKVEKVFSKDLTTNFINSILAMPHGVMAMSPDIPGLVETSTNLATVKMQRSKIVVGTSQRSSIETAKRNITDMVVAVFQLAGAKAVIGDSYPGWQPNMDSQLLKISKEVFKKLFKKNPKIKAIHAGLETGLLGSKYPGLDMISFGPTIQGAHSPDERLNIKDVEKFYNLVKGILKELA
jgi:dipeptidase D